MPIFLFTDIEGSTKKWEKFGEEMAKALVTHDSILSENIKQYGGNIIKHTGDGIFAIFINGEPLKCSIEIQKKISGQNWGTLGELRVRMALHAGDAEKRGEDYFGPVINRTARILSTGWGGQIIVTPEVMALCTLPENASLDDLGVHLLKDLSIPQHLYGLIHPALHLKEFPALLSLSAHPHNLPPQSSQFIGRSKELEKISEQLNNPEYRLITLLGNGGIGKSRLALQVGANKIESFNHGVYFIPLANLESSELLASTIAENLKLTFFNRQGPKEQLLNYLREKSMLLIVDNFEHILDGADLLSEIIINAPGIKILVTSCEKLNLQEEWVVELSGLNIPENPYNDDFEKYSAIQLFLQSAKKVKPDFTLSNEEKPYVIEICNLVEGIPLGIELAASWVRSLSCKEIAEEMRGNIDFLETSIRNVPIRHRSLRAVFDYSWNLLSENERNIFKKMSVFKGSFSRDAATRVINASISVISSLVDKSLLKRNPDGLYEILEILHKYVREKLREDKQENLIIEDHYCKYFSDFLLEKKFLLRSDKQKQTLDKLAQEIENIREIWKLSLEKHQLETLEHSFSTIFLFYEMRGWFKEGLELFEKSAKFLEESLKDNDSKESEETIIAKIESRAAKFSYRLGFYEKAKSLTENSLSIFNKFNIKDEIAFCLNSLADISRTKGKFFDARDLYKKSLEIYTEINNKIGLAMVTSNLGNISYELGEYIEAKKLWQQALEIRRETKEPWGLAACLNNLANAAYQLGQYTEVKQLHEESLNIRREISDKMGIANSLNNLCLVSHALGNLEKAKEYQQESLDIFKEIGDRSGLAIALNNLGNILCTMGKYQEAENYCLESLHIRQEAGDKVGIAYTLNNLGLVYFHLKKPEFSQSRYNEALKTAYEIKSTSLILDILVGLSELIKEKEEAIKILFFIFEHKATYQETKDRIKPILENLTNNFSIDKISSVKEESKYLVLEHIIDIFIKEEVKA